MSRPRPSPPATWPSRRRAGAFPLPPSPFPLPRGRSPTPRSTPHPRAGEMPGPDRGATPAFRPLVRAGENRAAGGVEGDRLEARGGLPGSPRASRRSLHDARGSRRGRAGGTSGCASRTTAAFRPLGSTQPCEAGSAARPLSASGRSTAVRSKGDRAISPARVDDAGPGRIGAAGGVGGDRLEARGGPSGSPRASRRSPAPHAARVPDERAEHPGVSAGRSRYSARSRDGRDGPARADAAGHGRAGTGWRGGTYGTIAGRE